MFSSVAQFRALNAQPFGGSSDPDPYNLQTYGPNGLPHGTMSHQISGWAPTPSRPTLFAQPSNTDLIYERTVARSADVSGYLGSGAWDNNNNNENMLRRKTPSGTLSAGYDGTFADLGPDLHAAKQVVLSRSEMKNTIYPESNVGTDKMQYPYRIRPSMQTQYGAKLIHQFNGPTQASSTLRGIGDQVQAQQWLGYPPALDSTARQMLSDVDLSCNRVLGNYSVPTILQPPYQARSGPTASDETAPYGPYWPDGAFIPYRPAAIRDPRFIHQPNAAMTPFWQPDTVAMPLLHHNMDATIQPLSAPESSHNEGLALFRFMDDPVSQFPVQNVHTTNLQPAWQVNLASRDHSKPPLFGGISSVDNKPVTFEPSQQQHQQQQPQSSSAFQGNSYHSSLLDRRSHPNFLAYRDKVLSYAHSIYIELLASIHRSRKNSSHHGSSQRSQHHSHTRIYPKPPRQPASDFTGGCGYGSTGTLDGIDYSSQTQASFGQNGLRGLQAQILNANARDAQRLGLSSHRSSNSPSMSPRQTEYKLQHKAVSILKLLTQYCNESTPEWIDGMLLSGCLAYGLGDYHQALSWYSKILTIDRSNVEALSNLAATLLSLNRRQEAERYWVCAIRLRPSYFEAVEHLIGLLCSDHRGKEAVTIIDQVEQSLRLRPPGDFVCSNDNDEISSETSHISSVSSESYDFAVFDYPENEEDSTFLHGRLRHGSKSQPGFGSSGYSIPASDNGRMLALLHAKGNMLYALGDNNGAAAAFEEAVLIAAGKASSRINGLIKRILGAFQRSKNPWDECPPTNDPILLSPDQALQTAKLVFPYRGELPGLVFISNVQAKQAAISTTSNALLSLAKIYQDGMASGHPMASTRVTPGVRDILALYYLSLSLQPSPSTANNVGILLASIQQGTPLRSIVSTPQFQLPDIPGVVPGSGVALALSYYNYGLNLDKRHAHLYTNLGSLLKDIGQLNAAIKMYEQAVACDPNFDIALANLANAVKDQGRISDAIGYYKRAVMVNAEFSEAVCGLANALNSVCDWTCRGGITVPNSSRDRWHVNEEGMIFDSKIPGTSSSGLMQRVFRIVEKQLKEGETWGRGIFVGDCFDSVFRRIAGPAGKRLFGQDDIHSLKKAMQSIAGQKWEGANVVKLVERAIQRIGWQWYQDKYVLHRILPPTYYTRPRLPDALPCPSVPTVLPFHTFTFPFSSRQIRQISQRNGLRISCATLRMPWLPETVFRPPPPPAPYLNVGYVSSDFNNHPLAHLMQSVFGMHNPLRVKAFCYATTASDNSVHRRQIESEAPVFYDASSWSNEQLVKQIVDDKIHILVNLNGYTRGARNEVFAARPAPIQMSFMGFAGTLGAQWCDYLLSDEAAIPKSTLRPNRNNVDLRNNFEDGTYADDDSQWLYAENIIYCRDTFFCCDHRQSAPDSQGKRFTWEEEQTRRWQMRKELFPNLPDDTIIFGNFNQLYKIEPTTFRTWLRILDRVPNSILWLLRFPDLGEANLKRTAQMWAGNSVANRIIFTDVAPKSQHISRARVCDLFLDTPECNAHTTSADVLWSGTPLLTLPRYPYKMCSRMASSILKGALPKTEEGQNAQIDLIANSEEGYEERAVRLGNGLRYPTASSGTLGFGEGKLVELRKLLYEARWTSGLFDTRRWVRDLEDAYEQAWDKWVKGEGGDIVL